jgi:hypothetical protein
LFQELIRLIFLHPLQLAMNNEEQKAETLKNSEVLLFIVNILEYIKVEFFNCLIQSNLCTLQRRKFKLLVVFSAFLSNMTIGC